ncbi:MAG: sigma-70 family RNA polymerase sigma factor [Planctomycetota bacterium]|nr:sigma-70 family RNA polymerase sigma factor [Planctomycetota bacterium]
MPTPATGSNTDSLLRRIAGGDANAVRECIDRYGGLIWSLARRLLYSEAEAEDAVQDVFVELWQSAGRFDENIASETAFVAMIARRRLIDRRRKIDRRIDRKALGEIDVPASGAGGSAFAVGTDDEFDGAGIQRTSVCEEAAAAQEALRQLSPEQQRVLRLSIFQGLSHERIARATGLPLGTVKTHARRGLIKVRELLELRRHSGAQTEPKGSVGGSVGGGKAVAGQSGGDA